jgi:alpha-L-fucosidase 2
MKATVIQSVILLLLLSSASTVPAVGQQQGTSGRADMILWFNKPAENRSDSLAIGNGRLGAVLHHGVTEELIQVSEETLWANGPVSVADGCRMKEQIPVLWTLLDEKRFKEANELVEKYCFDKRPQLRVDLMADMRLTFRGHERFSDYRRELDMRTAIARLSYTSRGARFTRESFISAVDKVMVIKLTCDKPGLISFDLGLSRGVADREYLTTTEDHMLIMRGPGNSPESGLEFELRCKALARGGTVTPHEDRLSVRNADDVLLVLNAETNFEYGKILDVDLPALCRHKIEAAASRPYEEMRAEHVAEHSGYFNRVELFLGSSTQEQRMLPTDERVNRVRGGERRERPAKRGRGPILPPVPDAVFESDPELEAQVFQFARYLLIASSRPGTQPAVLHGIWPNWRLAEKGANNAYHLNINIAENYWPAEVTGLGEMHEPVVDLLEEYLPNAGTYAREGYGCGGVVCGHNIDAWLAPSRRGATRAAAQWVGGFGWLSQHVWEHYAFSGDEAFLRERGMPILMAAAEFLLDYSRPDPVTGKVFIGPSGSPENSFLVDGEPVTTDYGISIDQEIAHELFRNCLTAADVLNMRDDPLIRRLEKALPRLELPTIGKDGRLLEWRDERVEHDPYHRHFAHLYGFHPGSRITVDESPKEAAAVMRSLRYRMGGDTEADYAPGRLDWQQAWYLSMWARFRNKDLFQRTYEDYIRIFLEPNLNSWWQSRPYQYDGSGAFTAGVAEALVQSHAGEIHLLPCLPEMWKEGRLRGFRARGGVTVSAEWNTERVKVTLITNRDGRFAVRYGASVREINLVRGRPVNLAFDASQL